MTQLSALPVLSVQIAFNPTNIQSTTQTWTDVTAYVRDFQTKTGKQHYLDRIQASTVSMTLSNRDGYFLNGTTNGTGAVISQRLPIKITATYSSTTYNVFYGIIDSIEEKIGDYLNSDLAITASDYVKYMSLQTLADLNFWNNYTSDISFSANFNITPFIVTSATATTGTITFTCNNNFTVGISVIVSGLIDSTGAASPYNGTYTVATASSSGFTVNGSFTAGRSYGSGSAYAQGNFSGPVSFLNNGVLIYNTSHGVDISNGTGVPTSYINTGANEFWILGTNLQNATLLAVNVIQSTAPSPTTQGNYLQVDANGYLLGVNVSDGFWHQIGIFAYNNNIYGYVDGTTTLLRTVTALYPWSMSATFPLQNCYGNDSTGYYSLNTPSCAAYVDQMGVTLSIATPTTIKNRYLAGSILQLTGKSSADRIAEVLVLAGFGSITGGAYSVPGYTVGNSYQTYTTWTPGFVTGVTVEPYYWDNPVTTSTALDIILQITDTDIGVFYQKADGTFTFLDQKYFGGWTFATSTSSVSVGTGSKTFTVASGLGFTAGGGVIISGANVQMNGTVTSYSGTSLVVNITSTYGSGTKTSWNIGSWKLNASIAPSGNYQWTDNGTNIAYYGPTTQILRDDADLWTTVQVNPQAGTLQQFNNLIAEPRYGYSTLSKSATVNASLSAALSTAFYLGYLYQSPLARVGSVELRAETNNGSTIPAILGTNIYDAINFQRSSPGASTAGSVNSNMVVESISHNFQADPGQWHASFVLDPYPVRT